MSFLMQIDAALADLKGLAFTAPRTVRWAGDGGVTLEVDFTAGDSLSCAIRELRLCVPALEQAPFDRICSWADDLCRRLTYLLEPIARIEQDAEAKAVLARSNPPDRQTAKTAFYEIRLHGQTRLTLTRLFTTPAEPTPQPQDLHLTHEVLRKLVRDLVESIPGAAAA